MSGLAYVAKEAIDPFTPPDPEVTPDSYGYAFGGITDAQENYPDIRRFNPNTRTWTDYGDLETPDATLEPLATELGGEDPTPGRSEACGTGYDGDAYVFSGGNDDLLALRDCCKIRGDETGSVAIEPLPVDPDDPLDWITAASATAFTVGDSCYLANGYNRNDADSTEIWEYDPAGDSWDRASTTATACNAVGSFVISAHGHLVGGESTGSYLTQNNQWDESTDTFTAKAVLATGREYHGVAECGGKGYVYNGDNGNGGSLETVSDTWEYDLTGDDWTSKTAFDKGPARGTFAHFGIEAKSGSYDGAVYMAGGRQNLDWTACAGSYMFVPDDDAWTTLPNLTTGGDFARQFVGGCSA